MRRAENRAAVGDEGEATKGEVSRPPPVWGTRSKVTSFNFELLCTGPVC